MIALSNRWLETVSDMGPTDCQIKKYQRKAITLFPLAFNYCIFTILKAWPLNKKKVSIKILKKKRFILFVCHSQTRTVAASQTTRCGAPRDQSVDIWWATRLQLGGHNRTGCRLLRLLGIRSCLSPQCHRSVLPRYRQGTTHRRLFWQGG